MIYSKVAFACYGKLKPPWQALRRDSTLDSYFAASVHTACLGPLAATWKFDGSKSEAIGVQLETYSRLNSPRVFE